MKNTLNLSILALSFGLMTMISSCKEQPKEVNNGVDSTTNVEVKAPDSTQTVTPDSAAGGSSTTTVTTTTTEVKKDDKRKE